jgi:hypothetical protein
MLCDRCEGQSPTHMCFIVAVGALCLVWFGFSLLLHMLCVNTHFDLRISSFFSYVLLVVLCTVHVYPEIAAHLCFGR